MYGQAAPINEALGIDALCKISFINFNLNGQAYSGEDKQTFI